MPQIRSTRKPLEKLLDALVGGAVAGEPSRCIALHWQGAVLLLLLRPKHAASRLDSVRL